MEIMVIGITALGAFSFAGLALLILRASMRQKNANLTIYSLGAVRRRFQTCRRTPGPWSVIAVRINKNGPQRRYTGGQGGDLRVYAARRILQYLENGVGGMLAGGERESELIVLSPMPDGEFDRFAQAVSADVRAYTKSYPVAGGPGIQFGRYLVQAGCGGFSEALENAKIALRYAEQSGQTACGYSYSQRMKFEEAAQLDERLRKAIRENSFRLRFQPYVDVQSNQVVGFEILSRLQTPDGGMMIPAHFWESVCRNDLCTEFDYHIFGRSCAWLAARSMETTGSWSVSCNFSRRTVSQDDFAQNIRRIADQYGIRYSQMAIEITEQELESDPQKILNNLEQLHELGFQIYLDDFGTGYTSFGDLQNYPIDVLKLDISILQNAETPKGRAIFENMVALAGRLGIRVLCEGVENERQVQLLKDTGCNIAQGYYYYMPLDVQECSRVLREETV